MSYFGKGFKPKNFKVNEEAYDEPVQSYPSITWHSRLMGDIRWGFWSSDRENFPDGIPGFVDWVDHEMRFGTNPANPLVPVYITYRLRCVVIGVRKRWIVNGLDRKTYYYPWFTPKDQRVDGDKTTGHIQVMVLLPDYPELPFVLGLRGYAKTVSWSNDPNGFGSSNFPLGVEQVMNEHAQEATKEARSNGYDGPPIPWKCAWWVDLVPAITEQNKKKVALSVDVGHGTYVNPFVADMALTYQEGAGKNRKDVTLDTRFVGADNYEYFERFRVEHGLEWEKEWDDQSSSDTPPPYGGPDPVVQEDDEIPF